MATSMLIIFSGLLVNIVFIYSNIEGVSLEYFSGGLCVFYHDDISLHGISYVECLNQCKSRSRCAAVNFKEKSWLCRLNFHNGTPTNCPGYVYSNKSNWQQTTPCTCPPQYMCFEDGGCVISECANLTNPNNGVLLGNEITIGKKVTTLCKPGYLLNGSAQRTCEQNWKWSGTEPRCDKDPMCVQYLVSGPNGVSDDQLTETSYWCQHTSILDWHCNGNPVGMSARYARLNASGSDTGAWSARYNNQAQYVQVDFLQQRVLSGVVTAGRILTNQFVTAFKVLYSGDCVHFNEVKNATMNVQVRNPPSFEWREVVSGLKTRNYIFQDLNPHVDYIFRIKAINDYGCSEPCLPVSLYRPRGYYSDEDDEEWEDEFEARFGRQEEEDLVPIEEDPDETAPAGAVSSGSSLFTVPPRMPMDTPEIVTQNPESIYFEWQAARIPAYATKTPFTYVIEIKEHPSTNWRRDVTGLVDTRYFREGLSPTQDYHIRVRAESEFGISEPTLPIIIQRSRGSRPGSRVSSVEREEVALSTTYMDNITAGVPPRMSSGRPIPSNSRPDGLTISWSASRVPSYVKKSAVTYIIEKREPPGHIWSVFAKEIKDTRHNIVGLDPNQDYMFRVRARNEFGTSDPTLPLTIYRERDDYVPQRIRSRSGSRDSIHVLMSSHKRRSISIDYGSVKSEEDTELDIGLQTPTQPEYVSTTYDTQYGVEGKKGKITLQVKAYPLPTVHWYFKEEKLEYGDRYNTFITPKGSITLEIQNVGSDSVGEYKCYAENASGAAVKVVTFMLAEPPTVLEPLHDKLHDAYHDVQLKCRVDVTLEPTIKWMKDWRPLADSTRIKTVHIEPGTYILEISNAVQSDSGVYACLFENLGGKVTLTSRLTVEEDLPAIAEVVLRAGAIEEYYHVLEEIGRGQHGVVRKVVEMSTGKPYAANFMFMRNRAQKNFFLSEFEALRSINHLDGVLHLHDAFDTDRSLIFVTEILTGPDLLQKMIADGDWTEAKVAGVVKQLLIIVKELQSIGILHLDIKPSNIRLCGQDNNDVKLINFALARFLHPEEDITQNYGSVGFASPEQIDNDVVNRKTDMWMVGVLAYVLLSGETPFQGETDADILKATMTGTWKFDEKVFENFSKEGKDFITKLLVKNKKERMSVGDCLAHPWMSTQSAGKISTEKLKNFYNSDNLKREAHKLYTTAHLQSLMKVMHGTAALYQPAIDVDSGEIIFPDSDDYGDYLDEDAWIEWQLQYQDDPDSQEFAIRDRNFTVRECKHTAAGPVPKEDKDKEPECDSLVFVNKVQTTTFELGEDVLLMCSVASKKDIPVVTWYRDETLLNDAYRAEPSFDEQTGIAMLRIVNAKDYDTGVYKCVARNKDGRVSCQARLLLGERPGRPGQPVVTQVSGTEAFLTWTGPLCDGNSYILGYRLDYRKQGEATWVHGPCVTEEYALVSGLVPNTGYIFRLTCYNKYGTSPYSWASLEAITLDEDAPKVTIAADLKPLLQFTTFTRQQLILPAESRRPSLSSKEEAKIIEGSPEENFVLGDVLSKGSYGEYKLCSDKATNQQFVMKIMPYKEIQHKQITKEFEMLKHLRQVHIISVLDSYVSGDFFYMVFEHLSGMNFLQYMCLRKSYKEDLVARVVGQILDALQYLHHHDIAHCNLQPSSIVMASLRRPHIKIRDFTLAQKIQTSQQKLPMAGYPDFVAPEVIKTEPAGFCPDMWALGTLTFILLSGVSPFAGDSLKDTLSRILFDRYCVSDLYDNATKDSIKFVSKLLKRLPKNRATIGQCLKSRWLQQSDSMLKAKNNACFRTERLRDFSKLYLERRADPDYMDLEGVAIATLPRPTPGPAFKPILNDKVVNRHVINIRISRSRSKSASPLKKAKGKFAAVPIVASEILSKPETDFQAEILNEIEGEETESPMVDEVVESVQVEPVHADPVNKEINESDKKLSERLPNSSDISAEPNEVEKEVSAKIEDKPLEKPTTEPSRDEVVEESISKVCAEETEASKSDISSNKKDKKADNNEPEPVLESECSDKTVADETETSVATDEIDEEVSIQPQSAQQTEQQKPDAVLDPNTDQQKDVLPVSDEPEEIVAVTKSEDGDQKETELKTEIERPIPESTEEDDKTCVGIAQQEIKTETEVKTEGKSEVAAECAENKFERKLNDLSLQIVDDVLKEAFQQVKVENTENANRVAIEQPPTVETLVKEEEKKAENTERISGTQNAQEFENSKEVDDNLNMRKIEDKELSEPVESAKQTSSSVETNENITDAGDTSHEESQESLQPSSEECLQCPEQKSETIAETVSDNVLKEIPLISLSEGEIKETAPENKDQIETIEKEITEQAEDDTQSEDKEVTKQEADNSDICKDGDIDNVNSEKVQTAVNDSLTKDEMEGQNEKSETENTVKQDVKTEDIEIMKTETEKDQISESLKESLDSQPTDTEEGTIKKEEERKQENVGQLKTVNDSVTDGGQADNLLSGNVNDMDAIKDQVEKDKPSESKPKQLDSQTETEKFTIEKEEEQTQENVSELKSVDDSTPQNALDELEPVITEHAKSVESVEKYESELTEKCVSETLETENSDKCIPETATEAAISEDNISPDILESRGATETPHDNKEQESNDNIGHQSAQDQVDCSEVKDKSGPETTDVESDNLSKQETEDVTNIKEKESVNTESLPDNTLSDQDDIKADSCMSEKLTIEDTTDPSATVATETETENQTEPKDSVETGDREEGSGSKQTLEEYDGTKQDTCVTETTDIDTKTEEPVKESVPEASSPKTVSDETTKLSEETCTSKDSSTPSEKGSELPTEECGKETIGAEEPADTKETDKEQKADEDEPNEEDIDRQMTERAILEDAMIFC